MLLIGCLPDEGFMHGNINVAEYIKMVCLNQKHLLQNLSQKIYLNLFVRKPA